MAVDEGAAQVMREDLAGIAGITEKTMFGGLCFLLHGNMVCGISPNDAMYRVGKSREAEALALEGVRPMDFTGRPMGGIVEADMDAYSDDTVREALTKLALANAQSLPPK